MGKRLTDQDIHSIITRYQNGGHPSDIAAVLGIHFGTVYAVLKREGVPLTSASYKPFVPEPYILHVDPVWAAEFRGFFYADGSALLAREKRKRPGKEPYYFYKPVLGIHQRDDEALLIHDVQDKLGGHLSSAGGYHRNGYYTRPTMRWSIASYPRVRGVLEAVLLGGCLPARKRADIDLLYELILARYRMPRYLRPEDKAVLVDYYEAIKAVKRYKGAGG